MCFEPPSLEQNGGFTTVSAASRLPFASQPPIPHSLFSYIMHEGWFPVKENITRIRSLVTPDNMWLLPQLPRLAVSTVLAAITVSRSVMKVESKPTAVAVSLGVISISP